MTHAIEAGDRIEIRGYGSLDTRNRAARIGRNPRTGEKVEVPAKSIAFFKPSRELLTAINAQRLKKGEHSRQG